MSKHTPITWRYEYGTGCYCSSIIASNGNIICSFADDPEEQDAALMITAPELLAAAQWVIRNPGAHPSNIRSVLEDAVAKATGVIS